MKIRFTILFLTTLIGISCFGQDTNSSDSIFQAIIEHPKTKLDRNNYKGGVVKEFYELENVQNEWVALKEFDAMGVLREKGVYFNGHNYGVWTEFDSIGEISSLIDYSIPKQWLGQNQIHTDEFEKAKAIGDSLLHSHFDPEFLESIRLNASRTYWYAGSNSGSWFESALNIPEKFKLRYTVVILDTVFFTPIEITLQNHQIISYDGIPDTSAFKFQLGYGEALEIAKSMGYGQVHETAFSSNEFMHLTFDRGVYYWTISSVSEEEVNVFRDGYNATLLAEGQTLLINAYTGQVTEQPFDGIINRCR